MLVMENSCCLKRFFKNHYALSNISTAVCKSKKKNENQALFRQSYPGIDAGVALRRFESYDNSYLSYRIIFVDAIIFIVFAL